jgi:hypothetical protein
MQIEILEPQPRSVRTLKIEADGDFFKRRIKPKIRMMGYWLERAGFRAGNRVHVTCVGPGVIELRACSTHLRQNSPQEPVIEGSGEPTTSTNPMESMPAHPAIAQLV